MRTIITIPDEQAGMLAELCQQKDISRAEAIRQAISIFLKQNNIKNSSVLNGDDEAFGIWKDRDIDGVEYQRELRKEWDREWDKK